jgi:hypothetical protein
MLNTAPSDRLAAGCSASHSRPTAFHPALRPLQGRRESTAMPSASSLRTAGSIAAAPPRWRAPWILGEGLLVYGDRSASMGRTFKGR